MDKDNQKTKEELTHELEELRQRAAEFDIIERQREWAEERLKESQERFKRLSDASNEGVIIHDDNKIVDANQRLADMLGYEISELIGSNSLDYVVPQQRKKVQEYVKSGSTQCYETKMLKKDKSIFVVEICSRPIVYEERNLRVAAIRDITRRKKAEERLHKINSCFLSFTGEPKNNIQRIVNLCGELMDADSAIYNRLYDQYIYSVGTWKVPTGYQKKDHADGHICTDIINRGPAKPVLVRHLGQTDYFKTDPTVAKYKLKTYYGASVNFNKVTIGSLCVVFGRDFIPTEEDENIMEMLACAIGVEEERARANEARQQNMELYRSLVTTSPDAIILSDSQGKIIMVNNQTAQKTGHTNKGELIGKSIFDLVAKKDKKYVKADLAKIRKQGKIVSVERKLLKKDGSAFIGEINASVVKDSSDAIMAIIHAVRDITIRKESEKTLRNSERMHRDMFDSMGEWIHVVDRNLKVVLINEAFGKKCKELGVKGDPVGKTVFDIFKFLPVKKITKEYQSIFKKGKVFITQESNKIGKREFITETRKIPIFKDGKVEKVLTIIRDITQSKKAEQDLKESENRFKTLFESASEAIFLATKDKFIDCNTATLKIFGCKRNQIIGHTPAEFSPPRQPDGSSSKKKAAEKIKSVLAGRPQRFYWKHKKLDGTLFDAEVTLNRIELKNEIYFQAIVRDISETVKYQEELRKEKDRAQQYLDIVGSLILIIDKDKKVSMANKRACEILGYEENEIIGKNWFDNFIPQKHRKDLKAVFNKIITSKGKKPEIKGFDYIENPVIASSGEEKVIAWHNTFLKDEKGDIIGTLSSGRDITERRKIEKNLLFTRFVFDKMSDAALWITCEGKISYVNDSACGMLRYSRKELLSMTIHDIDINFPKNEWAQRWEEMRELGVGEAETLLKAKDGSIFRVEISGNYMKYNGDEYLCAIARDVTERERVEAALRTSEQEKAVILDNLSELVVYHDNKMRIIWANSASAESVDMEPHDLIGRYCYEIWHKRKSACKDCPIKKVFNSGESEEGEVQSPDGRYWLIKGHPVKNDKGKVIGAVEVALDITGIKRAEEEKQRSTDVSRRILEETVIALAATAERRDPYTAGHQRRVAQLACAIARELELEEDKVEGIRMASIIHDVGKVYVPAEILSKPSRLSELEFNIIKTHPQVGYEILKPVEFPWPVALVVYQHHEKLNGSGYPKGVSDADILLEAKILTVADVVEAMASHRPYRAALGIDKALQEITKNKGTLYDPEVVDACIKLFKTKKFKFASKDEAAFRFEKI